MGWTIVSTVIGVLIVLFGFAEVFLTLVHPHARGRITRLFVAGVWRTTGRLGRRARAASGPIAAAGVVLVWAALQTLGWAFIYLPHIPDGFFYVEGIDPGDYWDFLEALYFSMVSLSTVGFGEVVPVDPLIRILSPLEAITGFVLLSGAAAWLLQLFPALGRRRSTALWLSLLGRSGYPERLATTDAASAASLLQGVAQQIATIRVDLSQSPESYYFREGEAPTSLGHALPVAQGLAAMGRSSPSEDVRAAVAVLDAALDDLTSCLRADFSTKGDTVDELIASFAREHS